MNENPYASPSEVSVVAPSITNRKMVKRRLNAPAIVTIVGSGLMLAAVGFNVVMLIVFSQVDSDAAVSLLHLYRTTPWLLVGIVLVSIGSVISLYGGVQMLRLKQYPVCVVAAVIMLIPFTSPCSWIGVIVGIWTLVVLLRRDTRAVFAEASGQS